MKKYALITGASIGFAMGFAIFGMWLHRRHPLETSYTQVDWSATRDQVNKTLTDWNAVNPKDYIDASDRSHIERKLHQLLQDHNLGEQQVEEAEVSCLSLIESLSDSDYTQFIRARLPSEEYKIPDVVVNALHHFSDLPASASPLDDYQNIWTNTFTTNVLWSKILFANDNAIILRTNMNYLRQQFQFPEFVGSKGNVYVVSWPSVAFNYDGLQQKEIGINKRILLLSLFFMAKEPVLNQARPFMITFFWDSSDNKWIPIQFAHGFIENPTVRYRFF
jgi:hypothetical protein